MTETSAKKDVQKLQRTVVDALEDVKAQDLVVFDTEHLSSLFERVIVASGTSNRQTKALAASVRDKVRDAGFGKPRIEGEDNGEWIIVDCGAVVVHVMQPTIRGYYNLEEIWGEKPVRLKFGAPKPVKAAEPEEAPAKKSAGKKPAAKKAAAGDKKPAARSASGSRSSSSRSDAAKPATRSTSTRGPVKAAPAKTAAKSAPAKTAAAKKPAAAPAKLPVKTVGLKGAKSTAKAAARSASTTAGKPAGKRPPAAKKTTARKA
ncbi:ribosome silencing factor [Limnohabitans sp. Jir61]|uniref:ribosome silencing factor n=1 Tax=Limnohabitans sp. Jir61 TaxID=1826168 RepID=UPI000D33B583|nr:ribosome silencing factor [Limnohabitans sp. Jir61]PUE33070.1 ribosome silencing factor [Limnohabitans sp. Jir61]